MIAHYHGILKAQKSDTPPRQSICDSKDRHIIPDVIMCSYPSGPPNKVDGFDTRVSETIDLFLFTKMPVAIHIFMIYSNIIQ